MDPLLLSRVQFGDTAAFHIIWPVISIGLALYMLVLEAAWLYTKNPMYFRQVKFWSKIFILSFGVGTTSGIPLQFEFGTNWSAFSNAAGDFFGNILGFESTVAFALEAAFLGIFVFGWNRVSRGVHLFSNAMVGFGATLSAFWIMVANSWMQAPHGIAVENGRIIVTDYWQAIFTQNAMISFLHMQVACVEATLFLVAGLSAIALLRKRVTDEYKQFFLLSFKFALALAIFATPLQIALGDISGYVIARDQPAKLAATELHWDTNKDAEGAAWNLIAVPDAAGGKNVFEVKIPYVLSLLTTHTPTGTVHGLNDFPNENRPSVIGSTVIFYGFRLMVGIGFFLFTLMLLGAWYWRKGWLSLPEIAHRKIFLALWIFALPLGFIATEAGWMVREMGRQPWVVYNIMRVSEAVSPNLNAGAVATTLALFTLLYIACGVLFVYYTYRIIKKGPDFSAAVPAL